MNRRQFLKAAAQIGAGSALGASLPIELRGATTPDWIEGTAGYQLPDWFEGQRAHVHTRLSRSERYLSMKVGASIRSMDARIVTRHVKSGEDGPFWPTKFGRPFPLAANRNFVAEMIADAHSAGCKLIGYYWITTEAAVEVEHPEWLCRDAKGQPIAASRRGKYLCLNTPYRDLIEKRLLELVAMDVDGLYFDFRHMPPGRCWCENCRRLFQEKTGRDLAANTTQIDESGIRDHIELNNAAIETAFRGWRAAVHAIKPDCVMVVSSSNYASLHTTHMSSRLFHAMDANKTEFGRPFSNDEMLVAKYPELRRPEKDVKLALGFALCRDGGGGQPAHVWLPFMTDETRAMLGAAGIITHGCIANIDVREDRFPDPVLKPAFELAARVSPALGGTRPVRWAAVHFCEIARRNPAGKTAFREMWVQSTARTFGAYCALLRERLPVGLITDTQLERGWTDGIEIIFLPNPEALTPAMKLALTAFRRRGGTVIEHRQSWAWHTEGGFKPATDEFIEMIRTKSVTSPMRVVGGPERLHASCFRSTDGKRHAITICNDFAWIDDRHDHEKGSAAGAATPQACGDVVIILRLPYSPTKLSDALTGQRLEAQRTAQGLEIALPKFDILSVVTAEL